MSDKLKYFIIIILFFVTNDTITFGTSGDEFLALFNQVLYAFLSVYFFLNVKNISSNKTSGFLFFLFLILILTTLIINQDLSKGYLKQNGAKVAIKIQRPGCEESIAVDLFVLRWYAEKIQWFLSLLDRDVSLVSVIDDFGKLLLLFLRNISSFHWYQCDEVIYYMMSKTFFIYIYNL
jgi:hypothetical protein